jgi:hypothetical protein
METEKLTKSEQIGPWLVEEYTDQDGSKSVWVNDKPRIYNTDYDEVCRELENDLERDIDRELV